MQHTLLPLAEFQARRSAFFQQMPENSIAIIFAGNEVTRSNDTEYLFCQNKHFYYLSGFNEPDAVLVLINANSTHESILFCREKDPFQEVWHGRRIGAELAQQDYGVDRAFILAELDHQLPVLLSNKSALLHLQGHNSNNDQKINTWLAKVNAGSRTGVKAPNTQINCHDIINELRLIKSPAELHIMREVNIVSGEGHQRAMMECEIGKYEYQIEADMLHQFATNGARHTAYNSIVAGGNNGNILHYTDNSDTLKDNELLLIDAGGELAGYAADITRTFPVNGVFTTEQEAIYQLVLDAQLEAINAIAPGTTFNDLNVLVGEILTIGLFELGLLSGELDQLVSENACKKYFIHGIGHWLGLDVHDVGDYQGNEQRQQLRVFEPGMVLTIEPGLYIPADDESVEEKWRGIAVRIEDNIAVTADGFENLTVNAPKEINEIEALMAEFQD